MAALYPPASSPLTPSSSPVVFSLLYLEVNSPLLLATKGPSQTPLSQLLSSLECSAMKLQARAAREAQASHQATPVGPLILLVSFLLEPKLMSFPLVVMPN